METLNSLERYKLTIFSKPGTVVSAKAIIPVFHKWIREQSIDELLIDVADYTHLPSGPNALLVGHEANLAIEASTDCVGLSYIRKRNAAGELAKRLASGAKTLLQAARMLESDSDAMAGGNFTFQTDKVVFSPNDRLLAPNTPEMVGAVEKVLQTFGEHLHGTKSITISSQTKGHQPTFSITPQTCVSLDKLIENLTS
ncbi:MAG: hypothetical protein VX262_02870 [Acidobacteriota bacterium]|nr:hypothetical protein [Acidobacteriota bacterium]